MYFHAPGSYFWIWRKWERGAGAVLPFKLPQKIIIYNKNRKNPTDTKIMDVYWLSGFAETIQNTSVASFHWSPLFMTALGQITTVTQRPAQKGPANPSCEVYLRAVDPNTSLTQCRASIKSPGNCTICQIQQVANQNQPTCRVMVPEQNKWVWGSAIWWHQPISKGKIFADSGKKGQN